MQLKYAIEVCNTPKKIQLLYLLSAWLFYGQK